jgi:hypothetical protein
MTPNIPAQKSFCFIYLAALLKDHQFIAHGSGNIDCFVIGIIVTSKNKHLNAGQRFLNCKRDHVVITQIKAALINRNFTVCFFDCNVIYSGCGLIPDRNNGCLERIIPAIVTSCIISAGFLP